MVNALASGVEEGRDKLRKAWGRRTYPLYPKISEWGNPAVEETVTLFYSEQTWGTETSKYP